MISTEIASFIDTPYYKMADVKMLRFFTRIGTVARVAIAALLTISVFNRNFWCRYLCPYGALMGIYALFSPTRGRASREHKAPFDAVVTILDGTAKISVEV